MSDSRFGLIELLLVFGLVIGWAAWQWWSVRRDLSKPPRDEPPDDEPPPPGERR